MARATAGVEFGVIDACPSIGSTLNNQILTKYQNSPAPEHRLVAKSGHFRLTYRKCLCLTLSHYPQSIWLPTSTASQAS